jgi:hypothetical protein
LNNINHQIHSGGFFMQQKEGETMNKTIEIVRGRTEPFEITVLDSTGALYATEDGERIIFGIKKQEHDNELLIAKAATVNSSGLYQVTLYPEDTEQLECGKYFFDVSLESGNDLFTIIEPMPLIMRHNVTKRGCVR